MHIIWTSGIASDASSGESVAVCSTSEGANVCLPILYKCNLKEAIEEAKDCVKAAVRQLWLSLGRIHTVIFREKTLWEKHGEVFGSKTATPCQIVRRGWPLSWCCNQRWPAIKFWLSEIWDVHPTVWLWPLSTSQPTEMTLIVFQFCFVTLIRVRRRPRFSPHSHRVNHSKPHAQVY